MMIFVADYYSCVRVISICKYLEITHPAIFHEIISYYKEKLFLEKVHFHLLLSCKENIE